MTLHPQSVAALELWSQGPSVSDPGFGADGIAAMRRDALAAAASEEKEPVDRVEDVDADGVRCRLYLPAGAPENVQRTVLFLHGGGFVFGDVDTHDGQARRIANRTGSAVLAVDYRRPPEHRFPAAPDDVDTALRWLVAHAAGLGLDPARVVALGDSAGGNLALVAALRNPVCSPRRCVYPFVDATASMPSYARTDGGLTRAQGEWFLRQYMRDERDLVDPDLTPILATGFETDGLRRDDPRLLAPPPALRCGRGLARRRRRLPRPAGRPRSLTRHPPEPRPASAGLGWRGPAQGGS